MSLTLTAIPHILTPTMASSLVHAVVPLLNGGNPALCKKAVVAIYRMALVYPDALRPAWPKIKDRLLTEDEDPAVTAAIVNMVCELGWRRPRDFLPLSPRLFEILMRGRNNWMAIKIIKLFATLTKLEPRLIRKLLPALTNVIATTPAMSLMYECIHGIIEGGILDAIQGTTEGDDVAKLCLSKLRSMLEADRDPNLKYVALLAFQRIARSNPDLLIVHGDVILECLDDVDVSIRICAIDLCKTISDAETLPVIVSRLLSQLLGISEEGLDHVLRNTARKVGASKYLTEPVSEDTDAPGSTQLGAVLSSNYHILVIQTILHVCSQNNYADIDDFEWYLQVLVRLIKVCPSVSESFPSGSTSPGEDISFEVGHQLLNVGVRVPSMRQEVIVVSELLISLTTRDRLLPSSGNGGLGVLQGAGFLVGEYAELVSDPTGVILALTNPVSLQIPRVLSTFIQAIPKVLCASSVSGSVPWSECVQKSISRSFETVISFLQLARSHPALEVQERATEYLELLTVIGSSIQSHPADSDERPALLSHVMPSLFGGTFLNPVSSEALSKVAVPAELESDPSSLVVPPSVKASPFSGCNQPRDFTVFYHSRLMQRRSRLPATEALDLYKDAEPSNVSSSRIRRLQRERTDPFYLDQADTGRSTTPLHAIIESSNGPGDFDIDDIPRMEIQLGGGQVGQQRQHRHSRRHDLILDETLESDEWRPRTTSQADGSSSSPRRKQMSSKGGGGGGVLHVDSSGLGSLLLDEPDRRRTAAAGGRSRTPAVVYPVKQTDEEKAALAAVERARKEMEMAALRLAMPNGGTVTASVVKRKKRLKDGPRTAVVVGHGPGGDGSESPATTSSVVVKQKKKKSTKGVVSDGKSKAGDD